MLELLESAVAEGKSICEKTVEYEMLHSGKSREEIFSEMVSRFEIMRSAAKKGVSEEIKTRSGLVHGSGKKFFSSIQGKKPLTGSLISKAIAYSLAVAEVNASMGLIVAAPTAGSCGILPGAMLAMQEESDCSDEKIAEAFFTSSGIGLLIAGRATFSAAVAGCGAEIGASSCMASAAIVEFFGGSAKQALNASAISLKSYLGLVCDPIAGLVEVPCIKRNAIGASNAFASAEMALNGVESAVPFPEVVDAMYRIGKRLPVELKETSKGGLATTPTALIVRSKFLQC